MNIKQTICPLCGVGCNIIPQVEGNRITYIKPAGAPPNFNSLCIKGQTVHEWIHHPDRLKYPIINGKKASWDEATGYVAEKILEIIKESGPNSLYFLSSSFSPNEDNYILSKFVRALGTNNIDNCARLCHSPTVEILRYMLGSAAVSNPLEDLASSDIIWIIGSNMVETHPVAVRYLLEGKRNGNRIIAIDPRSSSTTKIADEHIQIKPGKDLYLIGGILNVILSEKLYDENYVFEQLENFEEFSKSIVDYNPKRVSSIAGVSEKDIYRLAREFSYAENASIIYCMGICHQLTGYMNVAGLASLLLLTGKFRKPYSGLYPLRGKSNVQGACDMGALPNVIPGYISLKSPAVNKLEALWGFRIPEKSGIRESELFEKIENGDIRFLYVMGENPVGSHPNSQRVEKALEKVFLVVQDIFPNKTMEYADVIFPAACFAEREGTMTSTERRVQRLRKIIDPPGEARPDWTVIRDIAQKLGISGFSFGSEKEIFEEIKMAVPQYKNIDYETGGIWGAIRLFSAGFLTGNSKARLFPLKMPEGNGDDEDYPFLMITGRAMFHFHSSVQTGRSVTLTKRLAKPYAEISYYDADELGIEEGDMIEIESRLSRIVLEARVSDKVGLKQVFVPIHFIQANPNRLIDERLETCSRVPAYNAVNVRIRKVR